MTALPPHGSKLGDPMKTALVLLALLGSATCATAQEAVKAETKPVTNQEVNAVCTEITAKEPAPRARLHVINIHVPFGP